VHYTLGGPYFEEFRNCEYAEEWRKEHERMLRTEPRRTTAPS
jgi:hypothetical protein